MDQNHTNLEDLEGQWAFKILLLGNLAVGKTSLIFRFVEDSFRTNFQPTLGVNFLLKKVFFGESNQIQIQLQIWDISGYIVHQPRSMSRAFYTGASGVLLVFDLTRPETLHDLSTWKEHTESFEKDNPMVMLGNKNDLEWDSSLTTKIIEDQMDKLGAIDLKLTSAKTGEGVVDSFHTLAMYCLKRSLAKAKS